VTVADGGDGSGRARRARDLQVRGLHKRYGDVAAVDGVGFTVRAGSFLTLLGPSGSGKTTVLMAIAGFVEPSAGEILVDGRDITALPPERRNFGMVFQGYALFPHLSVAENVGFPLRVRRVGRGEAEARVARALDLVQLPGYADRLPRELSGGQQQRVALARALVFEPDLLLLDEPLSALDKKLRAELQWELKALHRRVGLSFVYVTHDQDEALSMSDEIAIMRAGRLVQSGPPGALYDRPRTRFVADFLGRSNFLSGRVAGPAPAGFTIACGGVALAQAGDAPPAGAEATIALRPEKIALSAVRPAGAANAVPGRILGWSFFGAELELRVDAGALGTIVASHPAWKSRIPLAEGAEVWLAWEPDDAVAVEPD
jgi:putative spermidine/putrescine transport system ATP-binding protein